MKTPIKDIEYDKIIALLETYDQKYALERVKKEPDSTDLSSALFRHVKESQFSRKAVLGIDIRSYASFDDIQQPLIPIVYSILFEETIKLSLSTQEFIFQKYDKETIQKYTISTGDGGYIIFDTPLHAVLFACNFSIILRLFNSYNLYPKLRSYLGELNLRFAITYDKMYMISDEFYGRALINNARIIVKDSLNRCLIDQGTYQWFSLHLDGIENLQVLSIEEIANIDEFEEGYDHGLLKSGHNTFFMKRKNTRNYGIINSDVLHIGTVHSKNTVLNIYNLHIQASVQMGEEEIRTITVSLGNLNTMGI